MKSQGGKCWGRKEGKEQLVKTILLFQSQLSTGFTTDKKVIKAPNEEGVDEATLSTSEDKEQYKRKTTIKLKYILGNIFLQTLTFNIRFLFFISGVCNGAYQLSTFHQSRPTSRIHCPTFFTLCDDSWSRSCSESSSAVNNLYRILHELHQQ